MSNDEPQDQDPPALPFAYLGRDSTPEEQDLGQSVGLGDGDHVPFRMFAKVVVRLHSYGVRSAGFDLFWRRARKHARRALAALAVNLVAIAGFFVHRIAAEAATQEHLAAEERAGVVYRAHVKEQLDRLEWDVRELRRALQRLGVSTPSSPGADGDGPWGPALPPLPDRVSVTQ